MADAKGVMRSHLPRKHGLEAEVHRSVEPWLDVFPPELLCEMCRLICFGLRNQGVAEETLGASAPEDIRVTGNITLHK